MDRRTFLSTAAALVARGADNDPEASVRARIRPPKFPDREFDVTEYGAHGDGSLLSTDAIGKAIAACSEAGGGRVIVPPGVFLTGAIHLKTGVNLHVSDGATLRFSRDPRHYLPVVFSRWEGTECMNYSPFLYAFEQHNIAITGGGVLDGQADCEHWWGWKGKPGWSVPTGGSEHLHQRGDLREK